MDCLDELVALYVSDHGGGGECLLTCEVMVQEVAELFGVSATDINRYQVSCMTARFVPVLGCELEIPTRLDGEVSKM